MELTQMDWVRAALWNAHNSGLSLFDVIRVSEHAATSEEMDDAVNMLANATPEETDGDR